MQRRSSWQAPFAWSPARPHRSPETLTVTCTGRRERNGAGWKPPAIEWSVNGEDRFRTIVRPAGAGVSAEVRRRHTFDRHRASNRGAVVAQNGGVSGTASTSCSTRRPRAPPCATISIRSILSSGSSWMQRGRRRRSAQALVRLERPYPARGETSLTSRCLARAVNAALNALRPHYHLLGEPYGELAESGGWPLSSAVR